MSHSKDTGCRQRKLPNLPTFASGITDEIRAYKVIKRRHTENDIISLRGKASPSHTCGITKEIVERIKAAEIEKSPQQVEMDSVKQDTRCKGLLGFSENNIALFDGAPQRIARILETFQDDEGYWIRKIEITKVPGQGLGFFIKKGNGFDRKSGVFISRVSLGSILDAYGLLHTGDEVLEVNKVNLRGFQLEDVALMMQIPDKLLLTTKSRIAINNWQKSPRNIDQKQGRRSRDARHHEPLVKQLSLPEEDHNYSFDDEESDRLIKSLTYSSKKPNMAIYSTKSLSPDTHYSRSKTLGAQDMQRPGKSSSLMKIQPFRYLESPDNGIGAAGGNRNVPDVPSKVPKSPRRLPTPPSTSARKIPNVSVKEQGIDNNNSKQLIVSTSPSSAAFKRAELYRVQPLDHEVETYVSSRSKPILKIDVVDEEQQNAGNRTQRRGMPAKEQPKSPSRIGILKGLSSLLKDERKDAKEPIERIYQPYKSDDLNSEMKFTRAFSGMLSVYVDRVLRSEQKLRASEFYCTIEIDDEFKASTTKKGYNADKTITFDEQFDIEMSHASEMTIYIFETKHEHQHSLSGSGVVFLEKVLSTSTSRSIALELEGSGVLHISLDFTEAVKYLKRTPSSRKRGVFGFNIVSTLDDEHNTIPKIVRKCVSEVEKRGMDIVGIYRVSGNAKKKRLLKAEFDQDSSTVDVSEDSGVDCNVLTGIIKDYLRELPEPLIPETAMHLIDKARESAISPDMNKRQDILCELLRKLPYGSRATLIYIMDHLIRVQEKRDLNKMDIANLAVCFGPVLMCPPTTKAVLDFKKIIDSLEYLLKIWPKHHERGVEIEITNM